MFLSRNKKNNVYPCKPEFYYIKVGFKGVKIISACFHDDNIFICKVIIFGRRHAKVCFRAYADREGPDQSVHPRSGPGLSANRIIGYYRIYKWGAKVLVGLCAQDDLNLCILRFACRAPFMSKSYVYFFRPSQHIQV